MSAPPSPTESQNPGNSEHPSIVRRSLHAVFSPFSPAALALLPRLRRPARYTRADAIPETQPDSEGQQPTMRDYYSINLPSQVRVPKKMSTPVRVEGKVWFANERTWVSWLNISVVLAALSLALFNSSKDSIATYFAYTYAIISVCTLVYGWALYQHRISMIRRRDPGHFDNLVGPVVLSVALFVAVLANFIIRVQELRRKEVPIPGAGLFGFTNPSNQTIAAIPFDQQRAF